MIKRIFLLFITPFIVFALCASSQALLIDRGSGLIYDTDRDITWLQDANYAKTSGFDADGLMTWSDAMNWAETLSYFDSARGVFWNDWRLPTALNQDGSGPCFSIGVINCTGSEMGHLFFEEGVQTSGIFTNVEANIYWSGTPNVSEPAFAWVFHFGTGFGSQFESNQSNPHYAWAVRPGDVPEPGICYCSAPAWQE